MKVRSCDFVIMPGENGFVIRRDREMWVVEGTDIAEVSKQLCAIHATDVLNTQKMQEQATKWRHQNVGMWHVGGGDANYPPGWMSDIK